MRHLVHSYICPSMVDLFRSLFCDMLYLSYTRTCINAPLLPREERRLKKLQQVSWKFQTTKPKCITPCKRLHVIRNLSRVVQSNTIKDFPFALCILLVWRFKTCSLNTRMYAVPQAQKDCHKPWPLTFRNLASRIQDGRKITLWMPHFIFIQQISVLNILNMLYNLHYFLFKMPFIS